MLARREDSLASRASRGARGASFNRAVVPPDGRISASLDARGAGVSLFPDGSGRLLASLIPVSASHFRLRPRDGSPRASPGFPFFRIGRSESRGVGCSRRPRAVGFAGSSLTFDPFHATRVLSHTKPAGIGGHPSGSFRFQSSAALARPHSDSCKNSGSGAAIPLAPTRRYNWDLTRPSSSSWRRATSARNASRAQARLYSNLRYAFG